MIIADENIDHSLIKALRDSGFEVYSIYEQQRGIADEFVIELSRNPPRIILTEDKDFGEWVFAHNVRDISVILLRYHWLETEAIKHRLVQVVSKRYNELMGKFTTLTTQKIRVRSI